MSEFHLSLNAGKWSYANWGTPDVVSVIARRLDNLIDALAIRGEVEGAPPDYDARTDSSGVVPRS